jgi:EmrB/QacA subfamily drug resistance transporter
VQERIENRKLVVASILLAMFMAAMEATVVATAMPTVVAELSGLELYGWVGSIYMLATTVTIPLWGKLSDLRGRRPVMLAGLVVFLLGSILSGMATSMQSLIVFRAIQGVGAGALQPIAMTIIGDIFTIEERAKMQGVFGAVWGVAGIVGPLLGGLIVKALSWRWVFYVNVPFGLLSGALLIMFFKERARAKKEVSFDFGGAVLLSVCILSVLGASAGSRTSVLAPVALVSLVLFVMVQKRVKEPILPLALFQNRVLAVGSAVSGLLGAVMMASVMYTPLYVQAVRGGTPTDGGTAVAPMLIGWPLASALSARLLVKMGFRPLVRAGLVSLVIAGVALAYAVSNGSSLTLIRVVMFVMGAGMGLVTTALIIAVQDAVEWHQRGVATSSQMFFRTIGGAVIVGALGALLARGVAGVVPEKDLAKMLGPERTAGIPKETLASYADSIGGAMVPLFWVIAGASIATMLLGFFFPDVRVKARGPQTATAKPEAGTTTSTPTSTPTATPTEDQATARTVDKTPAPASE